MPEANPSVRAELASGARRGLSLAGALTLSQAGVAVAEAFGIKSPLTLALAATLLFAIPLLAVAIVPTSVHLERSPALAAEVAFLVIGTAGSLLGLAVVVQLIGTAQDFYCAPEVPWRVEIAAFGGFALGLLDTMFRRHGQVSALSPLVYLGFFWIAPWYGFFQAPAFLAQAIFYSCEERSLMTIVLSVIMMAASQLCGLWLAAWFSKRQRF